MKLLTWERRGGDIVALFGSKNLALEFRVWGWTHPTTGVVEVTGEVYFRGSIHEITDDAPDEATAQDACEQWLHDWLGEAGERAMLAGARERLERRRDKAVEALRAMRGES